MKKNCRIIAVILSVAMLLSMNIVASAEDGSNYEEIVNSLNLIANETIEVETQVENEYSLKTYKNIQDFVNEAEEQIPNISKSDIGKFLIEYTGQGNSEELPDNILVETADFFEIAVQEEYLQVTPNGSVPVSEMEAMSAIQSDFISNDTISPMANWTSSDGYMSIETTYSLSKTSGNKKYYVVSAKANWLKEPAFTLKDVICISNTATFDDSYNDFTYYKQSHSCYRNGMLHNTSNKSSHKYADGSGQGSMVEFFYNSTNGVGARVDIQGYGCANAGEPGQHTFEMNYMEAYIRYRIICNTGNSYNIQGAYSHAEMGVGSIGLSISSGGVGISFSYAGSKSDFKARPVTINA